MISSQVPGAESDEPPAPQIDRTTGLPIEPSSASMRTASEPSQSQRIDRTTGLPIEEPPATQVRIDRTTGMPVELEAPQESAPPKPVRIDRTTGLPVEENDSTPAIAGQEKIFFLGKKESYTFNGGYTPSGVAKGSIRRGGSNSRSNSPASRGGGGSPSDRTSAFQAERRGSGSRSGGGIRSEALNPY